MNFNMNAKNAVKWHRVQMKSNGGIAVRIMIFHLLDDSSAGYKHNHANIRFAVTKGSIFQVDNKSQEQF